MKACNTLRKSIAKALLIFIMLFNVNTTILSAQEEGSVNKTMKEVLEEAKRSAANNKYKNVGPIIMIIGVISLVGFAVYISFFKEDDDVPKKSR
jgi:nucleoside recognition membrane protein YjiH